MWKIILCFQFQARSECCCMCQTSPFSCIGFSAVAPCTIQNRIYFLLLTYTALNDQKPSYLNELLILLIIWSLWAQDTWERVIQNGSYNLHLTSSPFVVWPHPHPLCLLLVYYCFITARIQLLPLLLVQAVVAVIDAFVPIPLCPYHSLSLSLSICLNPADRGRKSHTQRSALRWPRRLNTNAKVTTRMQKHNGCQAMVEVDSFLSLLHCTKANNVTSNKHF